MAKNDSTCPQALLGESVYLVLLRFSFSLPPLALRRFPKVCYSCRPGRNVPVCVWFLCCRPGDAASVRAHPRCPSAAPGDSASARSCPAAG